ncbi:response regulator [Rhodoplanes sp. TEM]|uniref:Response regulator n=1 Tax=Rhodoplanes tepidamans TaxID=200616 RepID=A0ABT5JAV4_RHOTP|nr:MULTISPECIES: response regulator [Rhodoplanes]MDC7786808.1 response regulator [Rhodoplanes tepidamans]MDC7985992.1 response regulator [Rhodoplanes sp. TEM]MDQ0355935.1 DNA-binding response OmpR family regulator [Rhodoplanes tepidamans]
MVRSDALIAIVEDDDEIRRLVAGLLVQEGFAVAPAAGGADLDALLARETPDLVILDLMLPGEDGLSICRRLRARSALPILMLTAKGDAIDRVVGLELGADDYLVKPFEPRELVARVRAVLRRTRGMPEAAASRRYAFEGFVVDLDARQLETSDGAPVPLTSAEFDLLACFVQRPRRVLSRDQLLDWTRGRDAEPFDRTIDMTISRLRRKIDQAAPGTTLITTVRNTGYLFVAPVKQLT